MSVVVVLYSQWDLTSGYLPKDHLYMYKRLKLHFHAQTKCFKTNCNQYHLSKRRIRISSGSAKSVYVPTKGPIYHAKIDVRNVNKACFYSKHRLVAP